MKKYLKMIPIMIYPYAYIIPLIVLFLTPAEGNNMDSVYLFIFIYALALHVFVLFIAIYNSIVTAKGKYDLISASKINMIIKCVQIPAYVFHFILGCLGSVMSVWGIGIVIFVIIVDFITIIMSGISSIGCACLMYKKNAINKKMAILMGIASFIYCIDVFVAILYYLIAKRKAYKDAYASL